MYTRVLMKINVLLVISEFSYLKQPRSLIYSSGDCRRIQRAADYEKGALLSRETLGQSKSEYTCIENGPLAMLPENTLRKVVARADARPSVKNLVVRTPYLVGIGCAAGCSVDEKARCGTVPAACCYDKMQ